jgi:arginine/lysine/ornithine decarboxylase
MQIDGEKDIRRAVPMVTKVSVNPNSRILVQDFFNCAIKKVTPKIKGKSEELVRLLRERRIEPEMVAPTYVLCMAGLGDTRESLERLSAALLEIDKILSLSEDNCPQIVHTHLPMRSGMKDPFDRNYREASLEKANGMISAEYLWAYPPGIPIITPGEIFDGEIIGMVKSYYESGLSLYSDKRGRIYCSDTLCVISD